MENCEKTNGPKWENEENLMGTIVHNWRNLAKIGLGLGLSSGSIQYDRTMKSDKRKIYCEGKLFGRETSDKKRQKERWIEKWKELLYWMEEMH